MSSAMEYRVRYADRWTGRLRTRKFRAVIEARDWAQEVHGEVQYSEPGGVWQTLTEGAGEVGEVPRLAEGRERGFESRPPSVSVSSVPQVPVGEHECVTCTRCACTYAAAHPACPRCSEAGRSVPSVPEETP